MKPRMWLESEVAYGRELVRSAIEGGLSAREKALAAASPGSVPPTRTSLPLTLMGASVGLLAASWGSSRRPKLSPVWFALLGGLLGFGTNLALNNRQVTEDVLRGAMKNISLVRDAHWLTKNPIDYA